MDYFVNILFDSSGWLPFVHINWNHPSNDIFDLGSRERVSYSIWFIVIPADLTVERIHKKTSSYIQNINVFGMKRKHKYRFVLFEYLGIVGFSIILGIVLGICESKL